MATGDPKTKRTNAYLDLKDAYGADFNVSEKDFNDRLDNDPKYAEAVFLDLKDAYGEEFYKDQASFTEGLKKKERSLPSSQSSSESSQTISSDRKSPLGDIKHAPNVANKPIMVGGQEPPKPKKEIPSIDGKIDIEQRPSSTATTIAKEKFTPTPTSEKIDENYKKVERIVDTSELEDLKERQLDQYTPTRSQGRDIKALVKEASKPMQPTASVESAKVETAMMDLEADYLDYLQKTNPEMAEYQINKIEGIREKRRIGQTLNTSEEKELRNFRLSAIDAYDSAQRLKIKEIKLSSNFDAFNKGASALSIKIDNVDKQIKDLGINLNGQNPPDKVEKAQVLLNQRNALIDQLETLKQETGVTDEKMKVYSDAVKNTVGQEAADYTVGLYGDVKALEEKNRKELEATANRVLEGEEGVAKTIWKGYTGSIGTMATNILKLPKVIGDALGDNDYDAIDQMYYATDALQDRKQGMFGSVSSDDMPASYVYSRMFGEGLGSVVTFATPAGALGLTGKAANVAVGATAFATTEADYYKEALDLGMNPKEAARSATALAAITGSIESLVPDIELFNPTAFKRTVLQAVKEKGFKEGVKQAIENLPKKAQDIIATGNKEGMEELAGVSGEDLTKTAINILNPRGDEYETFDPKSYTESYIGGFMVGGGLKVFSRPETAKKERSPLQEATLLDAVNLKDGVMEQAAAVDVEKTAEVETVINEAEEIYNALKGAPSFGKLPKNMQAHVLSELQRKKKLEQGLKTLGIEDTSISNEIASIEEEVKFVLDNGQSRFDAKQAEMAKQAEPEVKAEEIELEPIVKEEVKVEPVAEEKVEPPLIEDKAKENVVLEPKAGDTVPLPPRIKGGQERTMIFTDEGWKQKVGDQVTDVNEATRNQAQEAFALTALPTTEKVDVAEQAQRFEEERQVAESAQGLGGGSGEGESSQTNVFDNLVDNMVDIDWDSVEFDENAEGKKRKTSGKSKVIDYAGRKIVIISVNGRNVPFYLSTGRGGKADVTSGKWYPIFGIGADGWLNKLSGNEINTYYGSDVLKGIAESLDRKIGDIRNDDSVPKVGATGRHIDAINKNLNPTENGKSSTKEDVDRNIKETIDFLENSTTNEVVVAAPEIVVSESTEQAKVEEAPKVLEGKEAAKAKVDAVAEKIKAALKVKGIEGVDVKRQGLSAEDVIDLVAANVKKMIDAGWAVKDAVEYVIDAIKNDVNENDIDSVRDRATLKANENLIEEAREAGKAQKTVKGKKDLMEKALASKGQDAKKAIFVEINFDEIASKLIDNKIVKRKCD